MHFRKYALDLGDVPVKTRHDQVAEDLLGRDEVIGLATDMIPNHFHYVISAFQ